MDVLMKIKKFISYWYFRYLLATELYIVESWERAIVHILFLILFSITWYFNHNIVMNAISHFRAPSTASLQSLK